MLSLLLRLIRIEYDADAASRLVVCGRVVRQWTPVEFTGWGTPLAFLFVTDGWWMRDLPPLQEP